MAEYKKLNFYWLYPTFCYTMPQDHTIRTSEGETAKLESILNVYTALSNSFSRGLSARLKYRNVTHI